MVKIYSVLANKVPILEYESTFVMLTVGEQTTFTVTVNDTDEFTWNMDSPIEGATGATFVVNGDKTEGVFTWTPPDHETVRGFV